MSGSGAAGDLAVALIRIEDVTTLADELAMMTYWAKAGAANTEVSVSAFQNFGSGGSTSVETFQSKDGISNGSWAQEEFAMTIPSISGKTIGAGSFLEIRFWFSAGSDFNTPTATLGHQNTTIELADVKMEHALHNEATKYERPDPAVALLECQRYYWQIDQTHAMFSRSSNDNDRLLTLDFPVGMRVAPTIAGTVSTGTFSQIGTSTKSVRCKSAVGNTTSTVNLTTLTAKAEL